MMHKITKEFHCRYGKKGVEKHYLHSIDERKTHALIIHTIKMENLLLKRSMHGFTENCFSIRSSDDFFENKFPSIVWNFLISATLWNELVREKIEFSKKEKFSGVSTSYCNNVCADEITIQNIQHCLLSY